MKKKLNKKHKLFADEYLKNSRNGRNAYKAVYPKVSEKTAVSNASRLLKNANVVQYLEEQEQKITNSLKAELKITRASQLQELEEIKIELKSYFKKSPRQFEVLISAIQEQNKLLGLYEPERVDTKLTIEKIIKKTK